MRYLGYALAVVVVALLARFVWQDADRPWDRGPRDPDDPPEWP